MRERVEIDFFRLHLIIVRHLFLKNFTFTKRIKTKNPIEKDKLPLEFDTGYSDEDPPFRN